MYDICSHTLGLAADLNHLVSAPMRAPDVWRRLLVTSSNRHRTDYAMLICGSNCDLAFTGCRRSIWEQVARISRPHSSHFSSCSIQPEFSCPGVGQRQRCRHVGRVRFAPSVEPARHFRERSRDRLPTLTPSTSPASKRVREATCSWRGPSNTRGAFWRR